MTPLERAAYKVINSWEMKTLLSEYLVNKSINAAGTSSLEPYEDLLEFQLPFLSKGYQIGEPWSGDIAKAPILFVSKAPSYSKDEICPRYLYDRKTDSFTIIKTSDVSKNNTSVMKDSEVLAFFNNRFKNALSPKGYGLHIESDDKKSRGVKYWGALRNNARTLLSLSKKPCRIRDVVNYFACTSIVPFKINLREKYKNALNATGMNSTLQTCWQTYSQDIITHSNATVIVLIGKEVFDIFVSGFNINTNKCLSEISNPDSEGNTNDIYLLEHKIGNQTRFIVNIAPNQGDMRNFDRYFVDNSVILKKLREVVAHSLKS